MARSIILPLTFSSLFLFAIANAATFTVINNCSFTIWAAAVPGGGTELTSDQTWTLNVSSGATNGRIWARTDCSFDSSGNGKCETGDCNGVLNCTTYGSPPNTLAEYALDQYDNLDFFDISLVDGFNVPMDFVPVSNNCSTGAHCAANITAQCPGELQTPDGCYNPCQVFKTDEYCCNSGSCNATTYSEFFKNLCPDAYSYPKDDANSTFTCPTGTNYEVIFCPGS